MSIDKIQRVSLRVTERTIVWVNGILAGEFDSYDCPRSAGSAGTRDNLMQEVVAARCLQSLKRALPHVVDRLTDLSSSTPKSTKWVAEEPGADVAPVKASGTPDKRATAWVEGMLYGWEHPHSNMYAPDPEAATRLELSAPLLHIAHKSADMTSWIVGHEAGTLLRRCIEGTDPEFWANHPDYQDAEAASA